MALDALKEHGRNSADAAGDDLDQRRLAGAVIAQQGDDLAAAISKQIRAAPRSLRNAGDAFELEQGRGVGGVGHEGNS